MKGITFFKAFIVSLFISIFLYVFVFQISVCMKRNDLTDKDKAYAKCLCGKNEVDVIFIMEKTSKRVVRCSNNIQHYFDRPGRCSN